MKYLLLFLLGAVASCRHGTDATLSADGGVSCRSTVSSESCSYYDCLEQEHHCGDAGYPQGYGKRYCTKFQGLCDGALTSDNARRWVRGTTQCLQASLADQEGLLNSCDAVADTAYSSHPHCYTDGAAEVTGASFCTLSPLEWVQVRGCINVDDILSDRGLKQVALTAARCSFFFSGGFFLDGEVQEAPDAATRQLISTMSPAERAKRADELRKFAKSINDDIDKPEQ